MHLERSATRHEAWLLA